MPQLDLTDIVSIIFSISFLGLELQQPAQMRRGRGAKGGYAQDWTEAFSPGAKVFNHKRKLSFIKYLTATIVFRC